MQVACQIEGVIITGVIITGRKDPQIKCGIHQSKMEKAMEKVMKEDMAESQDLKKSSPTKIPQN